MRSAGTLGACALILCLLGGCASYRAFQEGNERIASGDTAGGVAKLREATELDPEDVRYREAYFAQRQLAIDHWLHDAEAALQTNQFELAEQDFGNVLRVDPGNARALNGRDAVSMARSEKVRLDGAEVMVRAGHIESALEEVRAVLASDPTSGRATALLHRLEEEEAQARGDGLEVAPKLKSAYRKPVTLNLNNATLLQIFESMKLASGLNFMFDKDVKTEQRMTLHVSDKPVEDIVRLVLAANQLEKRVLDEDTLLVYPNTSAKASDYRELITRSFYLSYADIKQIASLLKTIVKVKDVFLDEKLNVIIVRDSPEVVRLAEKLIANEDVPDPEVVLELEVLEVSTTRLLQLGIQWPSSVSATVQSANGQPGQITLDQLHTGGAGIVSLQFSNPLVSAQLLEQASDSDLLANPRVRVRNRETAKILIGQRLPVVTSNAVANVGVAQSVSYLDVGLKLEIEPTVSLDDEVSMKVGLEVSSVQGQTTLSTGTIVYTLGTRNASTVLRVRDNETQILAGLIQHDRTNANNGVPGLNDLPVLNKLFGQANNNDSRSEIILLITPHIVRNVEVPSRNKIEIPSGTETSLGGAPIQLGAPATTGSATTMPRVPTQVVAPRSAPVTVPASGPATPLLTPAQNPGSAPTTPPAFAPPPLIPTAPGSPGSTQSTPSTGAGAVGNSE